MTIDHIGIAVRSVDEGIKQWESLFGYTHEGPVTLNTRQQVRVAFMRKPGSLDVKLIEPVDSSSPAFRAVRSGGSLHHICFRCESVEETVAELEAKGGRTLSGPEPGEAFQNEDIAFVYAGLGLNVELIDTDKRAE